MNLSYPVIVVPAVHLRLSLICFFQMTNWAAAPIGRSFTAIQLRTTWWHQWGRGILKNDYSVGVTTVTASINAETASYLLIPLDLAFTGHQPLREAESDYHHCRRCAQRGRENLDTSQVSETHFRINLYSMWICLSFVLVALLHPFWMNQNHYSLF